MKMRDILKRKYHCNVVNFQAVDIVMEMSAKKLQKSTIIPTRFVLVIDVSASMDQQVVEEETETLLDRVKVFAKLVTHHISEKDSLAIVTFSSDVQLDVPMMAMDKKNKRHVEKVVEQMKTRGATNVEMGLLEALNVLQASGNTNSNARDMIIIFTDGAANAGETDPILLVQKYRESQKDLAKITPLSAFTIGEYDPYLLKELAAHLGNEAFYWLNRGHEFEADMLMPVLLRDETHITDIKIEMRSLEGSTFNEDSVSRTHLQDSESSTLNYFIHSIPDMVAKHIPVQILFDAGKFQEHLGKAILQVDGTYIDHEGTSRSFTDNVVLFSKFAENGATGEPMLEQTTYCVEYGSLQRSPIEVANAIVMIADEKYRQIGVKALEDISLCLRRDGDDLPNEHREIIKGAIMDINKIKRSYYGLMGDQSAQIKVLQDNAATWISSLDSARLLQNQGDIGRIYAIQSTLETGMPTTRGVFPNQQQQPNMDWRLKSKLREVEKLSKITKKTVLVFGTSRVFEGKTFVLSERLRCIKVGWKRESIADIIVRCGGGIDYDVPACPYDPQPRWYVQRNFPDTYLICAKKDFTKLTYLVKQAIQVQLPILTKKFVFQSIKKKKFLEIENEEFHFHIRHEEEAIADTA